MKKEQGFTLIELLIVVAIIAIIAAIAVPNLLSARMAANEASAIAGLRAVSSAELSYLANMGFFGTLDTLAGAAYIDERFANGGVVSGYSFDDEGSEITVGANTQLPSLNTDATGTGSIDSFEATPVAPGSTGRYSYKMGSDWVIRYLKAAGDTTNTDITDGDPVGGTAGTTGGGGGS